MSGHSIIAHSANRLIPNAFHLGIRSEPRIGFGDVKRNRITGKQVTRKLPSKLVEQARSASVLAKRHVVDLMYKSIPTRHSALSTADFDCDQLVGDFSELRSYRNFPAEFFLVDPFDYRVSFFELSAFWRVPVSRACSDDVGASV
jgi:hypothetical protein